MSYFLYVFNFLCSLLFSLAFFSWFWLFSAKVSQFAVNFENPADTAIQTRTLVHCHKTYNLEENNVEPHTRDIFFTKYNNMNEIDKQFVKLSQSLINIMKNCIEAINAFILKMNRTNVFHFKILSMLNKLVKQMEINEARSNDSTKPCYLNIMLFLDVLFYFKRCGVIEKRAATLLNDLLGITMREMTKYYEYHAIWRWFCFVTDCEYDPYKRGSRYIHRYWVVQLGLLGSASVIFLPCRNDFFNVKRPFKPIPVSFARDIGYFTILGGVNCMKIPIKWRLHYFNGLTLGTEQSVPGNLVKFSPQTYRYKIENIN